MKSRWMPTQISIVCTDCLEGMRARNAGSVDVVVTSPPYNLGIAYRTYADARSRADYLDWCVEWGSEILRLLRQRGSLFLNVGSSSKDPLLSHELLLRLVDIGFCLQNTIHWIKSISLELPDGTSFSSGHFKPLNSKCFVNDCHEYLFHLTPTGRTPIDRLAVGVPYSDKSNISRWNHTNGRDLRCRGNAWFVPYRTIRSRERQRPHPATFPVELVEKCIRLHGVPDAVVMDPFLGLGATALAAVRCDVAQFIGFEIDPEYAEYAQRRVFA